MMRYALLFSKQAKIRLSKYYVPTKPKDRTRIERDVTAAVLARDPKTCNVVEYGEVKLVYRRYASLYFCLAVERDANELATLEMIQHYVEILDKYFGNVCELDLVFNFHKAHYVLDEVFVAGHLQETSKKLVARLVSEQDALVERAKMGGPAGEDA
ncbi:AP complex, mu/sigma subunit [Ostreococcus tauri]|uniref:AP complex subunit sigma n=1 Tax=Ostreococcus tauri TaxID=70448 RepID=A0A1Y5I3G7_OSTTA|nr:AP complex, mu/sigma subunit [Ostreococcus tauri]